MNEQRMNSEIQISRRQAVVGAGVAAGALTIAACGSSPSVSYSKPSAQSATTNPATTATSTTTSQAPTTVDVPAADVIAQTSDVPVGGGLIVDDVVITQETAGDFRGFSSVCTHRGCSVESVSGGLIVCPCHHSLFGLDGSVAGGPASRALRSVSIKVEGGQIIRA